MNCLENVGYEAVSLSLVVPGSKYSWIENQIGILYDFFKKPEEIKFLKNPGVAWMFLDNRYIKHTMTVAHFFPNSAAQFNFEHTPNYMPDGGWKIWEISGLSYCNWERSMFLIKESHNLVQ